jgi:hypothetical protein
MVIPKANLKNKIFKIFRACALVILFLLTSLFIFEIYLRIAFAKRLQIYSKVLFSPDSLLGFRYLPNAKGVMRFPAYTQHFAINNKGFVEKNFSIKKKKGVYRILVLGSSDECGLFTNGPLNYPHLLEKLLQNIGYNVEVINLSIDGTNRSMRNIRLAKGECIGYQPDLILMINDFPFTDDIRTKYRSSYKGIEIKYAHTETLDSAKLYIDQHIQKRQFQHYLIDYCYIYRFLIRANFKYNIPLLRKIMDGTYDSYVYWAKNLWWSQTMDKRPYLSTVTYPKAQSLKVLKETKARLNSNGIKLVVFNTYSTKSSKKYLDLFNKNGITYFALNVPRMEEYSFGEMDGHSSQKGHIAIAKALANRMDLYLKNGN